jgi:hypothetical protein
MTRCIEIFSTGEVGGKGGQKNLIIIIIIGKKKSQPCRTPTYNEWDR